MLNPLSDGMQAGLYAAFLGLIWYAYYAIIVVPQNEIKELKTEVAIQKEVPKKVVNKINKSDAERAQKEIDEEYTYEDINLSDSGVLSF